MLDGIKNQPELVNNNIVRYPIHLYMLWYRDIYSYVSYIFQAIKQLDAIMYGQQYQLHIYLALKYIPKAVIYVVSIKGVVCTLVAAIFQITRIWCSQQSNYILWLVTCKAKQGSYLLYLSVQKPRHLFHYNYDF